MRKLTRQDLVRQLQAEGLRFSEMSLTSVGEYAADDSDWNYKDIPHLHIVHELAEAYPAVIGDDIICTINMQKILGVWFPITLVNYECAKYHQVYYTTLFFFALVIETRSEVLGPIKTRVTTTYSIGSPRWLFWAMPILKALIRKNYKVLMSADLPMRDRRGELRRLGYTFLRKGETYTFPETAMIANANLVVPPDKSRTVQCNYTALLADAHEAMVGDAGLLGFRLVRNGPEVTILPRTCPHEGASLDRCDFSNGTARCPWHGRVLRPLGKFTWQQDATFTTDDYKVTVSGDLLSVEYSGHAG